MSSWFLKLECLRLTEKVKAFGQFPAERQYVAAQQSRYKRNPRQALPAADFHCHFGMSRMRFGQHLIALRVRVFQLSFLFWRSFRRPTRIGRMFKEKYQGGPFVDIFSTTGSAKTVLNSKIVGAKKLYEKR